MRSDSIYTDVFMDNGVNDNYTALINHCAEGRCLTIWRRLDDDVETVHQSTAKTLKTCKRRLAKFKALLILSTL